nr:hypothetical protein [Tanacetum cinerariifolium]
MVENARTVKKLSKFKEEKKDKGHNCNFFKVLKKGTSSANWVTNAPTIPVSADSSKGNFNDAIDIGVDVFHPVPLVAVDFFVVTIVTTLSRHGKAIRGTHEHLQGVPIEEDMSTLRCRMGEKGSYGDGAIVGFSFGVTATGPRELQEALGIIILEFHATLRFLCCHPHARDLESLLTISPSTYALPPNNKNISFEEELVYQRLRKTLTHVLELSSCIYLDDRAWGS